MDEIGINNALVGQLVNEHQNYEIAGVEYEDNGKIAEVDENMPEAAVDINLDKIPGLDPKTFEE